MIKKLGIICFTIYSLGCHHYKVKPDFHFLEEKHISSIQWKNDSAGCVGYRRNVLDTIMILRDSLLHKHEDEIFSFFGKPNQFDTTNAKIIRFIYFVERTKFCDGEGPFKTTLRNEEVRFIVFEFNMDGYIIDCREGIP